MRAGDVLALVRKRGAMFRELIKAFKREQLPSPAPTAWCCAKSLRCRIASR